MPQQTVTFPSIKDVPASYWQKLSEKKIFFGHQSVGNNIIDGIKDLMNEHTEIQLGIVETAEQADFKVSLFTHSKVGENGDPKSKIDAFADIMEKGLGGNADIAFLKFCFVDIMANSDIKKTFAEYKNTMSRVKNKYPGTTLIHITVPLTSTKTTWKTWIKKLIGKRFIWEYDHNVARNEFNQLLRREYNEKEPVFDLARIESTYPDGKRSLFTRAGKSYYSLVPDYTHDGGHLNEKGRKIVAEQLLILLANIANNKP